MSFAEQKLDPCASSHCAVHPFRACPWEYIIIFGCCLKFGGMNAVICG